MLLLSLFIFGLTALLGVYLLSFVMINKETPKGIALIHGPLAAIGLVILIVYSLLHHPSLLVCLICFVLAAMGGGYLFLRDLTGKSIPKWLAIVHGVLALIGFAILLYYATVK